MPHYIVERTFPDGLLDVLRPQRGARTSTVVGLLWEASRKVPGRTSRHCRHITEVRVLDPYLHH